MPVTLATRPRPPRCDRAQAQPRSRFGCCGRMAPAPGPGERRSARPPSAERTGLSQLTGKIPGADRCVHPARWCGCAPAMSGLSHLKRRSRCCSARGGQNPVGASLQAAEDGTQEDDEAREHEGRVETSSEVGSPSKCDGTGELSHPSSTKSPGTGAIPTGCSSRFSGLTVRTPRFRVVTWSAAKSSCAEGAMLPSRRDVHSHHRKWRPTLPPDHGVLP